VQIDFDSDEDGHQKQDGKEYDNSGNSDNGPQEGLETESDSDAPPAQDDFFGIDLAIIHALLVKEVHSV
jgi:hypothetical protein